MGSHGILDPDRLTERAASRAWRSVHDWSTRTLLGSIFWLLFCTGVGAVVFHEQQWFGALGAFVIGPIVGAATGLLIASGVSLLFAFRAQRDELRRALADGRSPEDGQSVKYKIHHHHYEEGSNPQIYHPASPEAKEPPAP